MDDLEKAWKEFKKELWKATLGPTCEAFAKWLKNKLTCTHVWVPKQPNGRFSGPLKCYKCGELKAQQTIALHQFQEDVLEFFRKFQEREMIMSMGRTFGRFPLIESPHVKKGDIVTFHDTRPGIIKAYNLAYEPKLVVHPETKRIIIDDIIAE